MTIQRNALLVTVAILGSDCSRSESPVAARSRLPGAW